ncbi:MYG1 family protein [Candidatus Nomurabacteria bacterium]|nr:MYG1 family protein [Candidatus Nomurabacteria bacterium]
MKNFITKKANKLVTHNGSFHADDIFACAALCLLLEKKGEKFEIIRTRDPKIIEAGDYAFDIGSIYDEKTNRFDHHQKGGAGGREGVEYSSFGLVWKKFGAELCESEKAAEIIDKKLVAPVDAFDNGMDLVQNKYEITPYYIQHLFFSMRPTWKEADLSKDQMFLECVKIAKVVLTREIVQVRDALLADDLVIANYKKSADKRIIILDDKYPFDALHDFPEPLFVIYPRVITSDWGVEAVRDNPKTFKNRKSLPEAWAGLREEELQKVTGVPDAIFCHRGLYLAVAKTKLGAIALAQKALS